MMTATYLDYRGCEFMETVLIKASDHEKIAVT